MERKIEKICKNCSLFCKEDSICGVNVIKDGEVFEMVVKPQDHCVWDELNIQVNQIRMWSDGKNGYIESPKE